MAIMFVAPYDPWFGLICRCWIAQ